MPRTVLKKGSLLKTVEFDLRLIDGGGDVVEVEHFETRDAAIAAPRHDAVAWVVERHTSYSPAYLSPTGEADSFVTVARGGDEAALDAGGW